MAFKTTRLIEFHDTDQAGICHFSRFFLFMESAEHQFLRSLGLSVVMEHEGGKISFPRVSSSCDYFNPVRFEDVVTVRVRVLRLGSKSITYAFSFRRGEVLIARGRMSAVCCRAGTGAALESIPIPNPIAAKIASAIDLPEPQDAEGQ